MNQAGIFLVGFMGAGKSTIGLRLARTLDLPFFDLDSEIELLTRRTIPQIFAEDGEPIFRKLEVEALSCIPQPAVVALGGGAFLTPAIRQWTASHGTSLFLQWPFETLFKRVAGDPNRPLARDPRNLELLYRKREPAYLTADLVWTSQNPDLEDPDSTVKELVLLLQQRRLPES